jgi:hypothetical protein
VRGIMKVVLGGLIVLAIIVVTASVLNIVLSHRGSQRPSTLSGSTTAPGPMPSTSPPAEATGMSALKHAGIHHVEFSPGHMLKPGNAYSGPLSPSPSARKPAEEGWWRHRGGSRSARFPAPPPASALQP